MPYDVNGKATQRPAEDKFAEAQDRIFGKYCKECKKRHKDDCETK